MHDTSQRWLETLNELHSAGEPCALVVVTGTRGSAPREAGARLIVSGGKLVFGTIGGGRLEHLAIEHAVHLLGNPKRCVESVTYPLAEKTGQCCGGEVTLFFETFPWSRQKVVIFGAGHVAQALAGLQPYLGAEVLLIDSRSEKQLQLPPAAERPYEALFIDAPEAEIESLDPKSLVLIMTHDHALDLEILIAALKRGVFPYVGLIGSARKWERFQKRLQQRGFGEQQIASVTCPIGAARTSKEPRAIAVSAAAELLEVMQRVSLADAEPGLKV